MPPSSSLTTWSGPFGVGDGLTALVLDYRLARVVAGACEALYMYAAMRWLVFRDVRRPADTRRSAWQERRSAR